MCGIAGFVSKHNLLDCQRLVAMRDALVHRGPDDCGAVLWDETGAVLAGVDQNAAVGLAHRRLSIIDLSRAGQQPMCNEDGSVWITYNGEFYNFAEYRKALEANHRFSSHTDTETIIHLYEEYGIEKTLAKLNGMFAFAIYDVSARKMILARDRVGKKPLYYAMSPDGSLVFASEVKALLKSGFIDEEIIDPQSLVEFWTYGYTSGTQTIYKQIRRLLPGHYAVWEDGQLAVREYWDARFGLDTFADRTIDDMSDELEHLLCDAIKLRMVADVPVGLFLSGGLDSSLIAALIAKSVGRDMHSYTIGFPQSKYDESAHARAVAEHLQLPNTMIRAEDGSETDLQHIACHFDEPFGDSSALPTFLVSKLAKQYVTVTLTGDGGDELFAGYNLYDRALFLWGDRNQRKMFAPSQRSCMQFVSDMWFRHVLKNEKLTVHEMLVSPRKLQGILHEDLHAVLHEPSLYHQRKQWYARVEKEDVLSQFQYLNFKTYLADDVLVKVDRMSMAHAQECRSPLLDYRIVEFAARLPYEAKIGPNGEKKYLLRHLLHKYIPSHLVDRPKQGFSMPWEEWCRGPLGVRLKRAWQDQANHYQNPDAAEWLFPENAVGVKALQWNAFSSLCFFGELA
jgi:asparagine synthase (glutamine-hydrolysing)